VYHFDVAKEDETTTKFEEDKMDDSGSTHRKCCESVYLSILKEVDAVSVVCDWTATVFVRLLPVIAAVLIVWSVYACLRSYLTLSFLPVRDLDGFNYNFKLFTDKDEESDAHLYSTQTVDSEKIRHLREGHKTFDSYVDMIPTTVSAYRANINVIPSTCDVPTVTQEHCQPNILSPLPFDPCSPTNTINLSTAARKYNEFSYAKMSQRSARKFEENSCVIILLHLTITVTSFVADSSLYWVMSLVQRHARPPHTPVDFTGVRALKAVAKDDGVVVQLLDEFLRTFHAGYWFGFGSDNDSDGEGGGGNSCLCRPAVPGVISAVVMACMYTILLTMSVFCHERTLRVRDSFCGYFNPECKLQRAENKLAAREARRRKVITNLDL